MFWVDIGSCSINHPNVFVCIFFTMLHKKSSSIFFFAVWHLSKFLVSQSAEGIQSAVLVGPLPSYLTPPACVRPSSPLPPRSVYRFPAGLPTHTHNNTPLLWDPDTFCLLLSGRGDSPHPPSSSCPSSFLLAVLPPHPPYPCLRQGGGRGGVCRGRGDM